MHQQPPPRWAARGWIKIKLTPHLIHFLGCWASIQPILLKNLDSFTLNRIAYIYEACYKLAYTPKAFENSKISFIPKPNKSDYQDPKAWRPITLLNFLLKGLERLILWDIQEKMGEKLIFHNQHAYTCNRGTDTAISEVLNYIEANALKGKKRHCIVTFMDISGAFDNAPYHHIIDAMIEAEAPIEFIKFYKNFLNNRRTTIKFGTHQITKKLIVGVGQGSILSPIAWNFYLLGY